MDSINSNSHAHFPRHHDTHPKPESAIGPTIKNSTPQETVPPSVPKTETVEAFADLFEDDQLTRLHRSLESIATMAESALAQFEKRAD